jgi:hypothetical protein
VNFRSTETFARKRSIAATLLQLLATGAPVARATVESACSRSGEVEQQDEEDRGRDHEDRRREEQITNSK